MRSATSYRSNQILLSLRFPAGWRHSVAGDRWNHSILSSFGRTGASLSAEKRGEARWAVIAFGRADRADPRDVCEFRARLYVSGDPGRVSRDHLFHWRPVENVVCGTLRGRCSETVAGLRATPANACAATVWTTRAHPSITAAAGPFSG